MVASWMEAFKMPMRQIKQIYTKSELAIVGWRSLEISHNMSSRHKDAYVNPTQQNGYEPAGRAQPYEVTALEARLEPLALKFVDERGEVDLRRLTGQEAMLYLGAMGIPMGRVFAGPDSEGAVTGEIKRGK